jgi:hypothetical protein
MWKKRIEQDGALLDGYTIGEPPRTTEELVKIGTAILKNAAPPEQCVGVAWQLIIAAFCVTLAPLGWSAHTDPGEEVVLRKGSITLRPWSELRDLIDGKTTLDDWKTSCALSGIESLPLTPAAASTAVGV